MTSVYGKFISKDHLLFFTSNLSPVQFKIILETGDESIYNVTGIIYSKEYLILTFRSSTAEPPDRQRLLSTGP
jgi:hypothetical protein